jgi:lipopolysaccharide transport system permease protein
MTPSSEAPSVTLLPHEPSPLARAAARSARSAAHRVVIEPTGRWTGLNTAELWEYRSLFFFLVWRDIKARHAQTVLGAGWAILQPLLTMVVFTLIFGKFARIPSDGVPYPVFSFAALVPWAYFANAFQGASNSLVANTRMFTKVYFPRLVIPCVPVLGGLLDFSVAFLILLALTGYYGLVPSVAAFGVIPLLVVIMMMTAAGVGCWLSAINIQYRDVKVITAFLAQLWMYATPIVYPLSIVPDAYRTVYMLNPMVGVIEGFRSVLLGTGAVPWGAIGVSLAVAAVLLASGALYFRRMESVFADVA